MGSNDQWLSPIASAAAEQLFVDIGKFAALVEVRQDVVEMRGGLVQEMRGDFEKLGKPPVREFDPAIGRDLD